MVISCRKITVSLSRFSHFVTKKPKLSSLFRVPYKNIAHRAVILCVIRQNPVKNNICAKKSPSRQNLAERACIA